MIKEKITINNIQFKYDEWFRDDEIAKRTLRSIRVEFEYMGIDSSIIIKTNKELTTDEIRNEIIEKFNI
jgi:hypothetical protein